MNKIKEDFLEKAPTDDMMQIVEILDRAWTFGLGTEIVYTALKEMKSNPNTSPLLALQITSQDWDI
mgnify:FL=1